MTAASRYLIYHPPFIPSRALPRVSWHQRCPGTSYFEISGKAFALSIPTRQSQNPCLFFPPYIAYKPCSANLRVKSPASLSVSAADYFFFVLFISQSPFCEKTVFPSLNIFETVLSAMVFTPRWTIHYFSNTPQYYL